DIKVPVFPESVSDGTLSAWRKQPGEAVREGEVLAEIETDKVVFEVPAPADGVMEEQLVAAGATVVSAQAIGRLAPTGAAVKSAPPAKVATAATAATVMPSAKKLLQEHGLDASQVRATGKGGRILKEDVQRTLTQRPSASAPAPEPAARKSPSAPATVTMDREARPQRRVPMTRLRLRIAERLVEAQRTAALLTTFNEVNMQPVMEMRQQHRERFEKEYGVRLGFMSFFVKASVEALKRYPEVNASVDGHDVVYHGFYDIGIAISSPRGLVVPILRDADRLTMAEIEVRIKDYGQKAQDGKLAIDDITGGTFSISNGGVFGSLLSTPILNPPQSAILGMHKIQERPMAEKGQVVVRPMMYLALTYDHRLVDGREAVGFLVAIKEALEDPARLLLGV
ncbi:MAG: 2-oxoglutarate dehydrogenase complex dihydrolipoyllysine-residue succinyltransferase, partial [Pseudomonadota bacterium]